MCSHSMNKNYWGLHTNRSYSGFKSFRPNAKASQRVLLGLIMSLTLDFQARHLLKSFYCNKKRYFVLYKVFIYSIFQLKFTNYESNKLVALFF